MKNRRIVLILTFAVLFALFTGTGCRIGSEESNFHGLWDNNCISLPSCMNNCFRKITCSCIDIGENKEVEFTAEAVRIREVEHCENSEGTGENGYITVKVVLEVDRRFDYLYKLHYVQYSLDVFDCGQKVGSAIVCRTGEYYGQYEYVRRTQTDTSTIFEDYVNVKIEGYIQGDYTFESEFIEGTYIT